MQSTTSNTLGMRRIMFLVDDVDAVVARLRTHGAELVGEIAQYQNLYRLCFVRGPVAVPHPTTSEPDGWLHVEKLRPAPLTR